jgi:SAM-dependent methyltransferase
MGRSVSLKYIEQLTCTAMDTLLRKTVINRLPPKAMLWRRFPDAVTPWLTGDTGLDLGCGSGSQLPFDKLRWFGIDLHLPSLLLAQLRGSYEGLLCCNVLSVCSAVRDKSVDVVVAFDLIEHFDKNASLCLIEQMERVARKRVIILTPNGYLDQPRKTVSRNPLMAHHSAWSSQEFKALGYTVTGWSGWKGFAGPQAYIRNNIDSLFQILMTLSQPLVAHRPQLAFHLLCYKRIF